MNLGKAIIYVTLNEYNHNNIDNLSYGMIILYKFRKWFYLTDNLLFSSIFLGFQNKAFFLPYFFFKLLDWCALYLLMGLKNLY